MSKKYNDAGLASASPLTGAEQWGVARAGADKYMTTAMIQPYLVAQGLLGLLARYHASAAITMATGITTINFNTSDYDPLSLVTTGASWVFTAPATGWYRVEIENFYVDPNSAAYDADDSVKIRPYKNNSALTGTPDLTYWDAGDAIATTSKYAFLTGSITCSLTATDTLALKFHNNTSLSRKVGTQAGIVVSRVA